MLLEKSPSQLQRVLAIETSCDDTSIAVVSRSRNLHQPIVLDWMSSNSQEALLRPWSGVVPEIAARAHVQYLFPLIRSVPDHFWPSIDAIAVTQGPGLLGPLLTGMTAAKLVAVKQLKPLLPVNHLMAHLEAIHLTERVSYPYLGVVLSGGHSFMMLVNAPEQWELRCSTLDDALGEALDKGGKLLGLPYPAGKLLDQFAPYGNPDRIAFPIAMKQDARGNLSYSGLKNALRLFAEKNPALGEVSLELLQAAESHSLEVLNLKGWSEQQQFYLDTVASYLKAAFQAVIQSIHKQLASPTIAPLPLVIAGGVANSKTLRRMLQQQSFAPRLYLVDPRYCSDNAAMIGAFALTHEHRALDLETGIKLQPFSRFINRQELIL